MKNKEEIKTTSVAVSTTPFWIRVFTVLLILGLILGAFRSWALGSIEGYESMYIEYAALKLCRILHNSKQAREIPY